MAIVTWWLISTAVGVMVFPVAWRVFSGLPDRGWGFTRALGLLAAGYFYWLGGILGVLPNDVAGAWGAVFLLALIGVMTGRGHWREIRRWVAERWRTIVAMEVLFLAGFALWAIVRAYNPEIAGTEKPMELAFLNSILVSPSFPPLDPWLSGHAISYYYFGYVLLALLTRLTGVASGVAFNLGNALWFALTALGAFSLLYNMLTSRDGRPRLGQALLGPLFVLISGNLEGLLEVLHARQLLWTSDSQGGLTSTFWKWLNIKDLVAPPLGNPSWFPERYLWWWRASRVVRDLSPAGVDFEVIDEFPFFSFLLADNHPHLLALPFVLLAVALALNFILLGARGEFRLGRLRLAPEKGSILTLAGAVLPLLALLAGVTSGWRQGLPLLDMLLSGAKAGIFCLLAVVMLGGLSLLQLGILPSALSRAEFWISAWALGALAFLNIWDFPIYLSLLLGAVLAMSWHEPARRVLGRLAATAIGLASCAVILYLPWYITFRSQAGGILPNVLYPTALSQVSVMFGAMLLPLMAWLVWKVWRIWRKGDLLWLLGLGIGLPLMLLLLSWAFGGVIHAFLSRSTPLLERTFAALGVQDFSSLVHAVLERRLQHPWTALLMGGIVAASVLLFLRFKPSTQKDLQVAGPQKKPLLVFVALLAGMGALLVLFPEFFYLRDLFETRMNTIFKFYFAAWVLWGLAGAYAATEIWKHGWGWVASYGLLFAATPILLSQVDMLRSDLLEGSARQQAMWILWGYALAWALCLGLGIAKAVRSWKSRRSLLALPRFLFVFPVFLGLVYTFNALWTKTNGFNPATGPTLDGNAYLRMREAEYSALQWMTSNLEPGVVAEAVGGSYSGYARVSMYTGFPTVLGWDFHEMQWRGSSQPLGTRKDDIQWLYETRSWEEAQEIVRRYDIDYVYIGSLEQTTYQPLNMSKFNVFMDLAFRNSDVSIFMRRGEGAP
jgi:uncharacterized membrane protein